MNILRHLEFIRAAEDETGAEEIPPENALAGEVPVLEAENPVVEETPETPAETPEDAKQHHLKGQTPWYMKRIHEETNKREAVQQELDRTRRERAEALALLEKQGGDKPAPQRDAPDFESAVDAAAEKKLLFKNSTEVRLAGQKEFSDFDDSLKVLTAVGATTDDFVSDIIDTDMANAHKMLDFLAKNPERAAQLVNMTSKRRVAELTRLSMSEIAKPAAPAPKAAAVSKVPAPKPVIDPAGGVEDVEEDKMSDEQWASWRKKQLAKSA